MKKKNTSFQQKKLPHRVKLLLDSTDVDLVQIGANIMKDYIPKSQWDKVLQMFSIDPRYNELYIPKWTWKIEGNDIIIKNKFLLDTFTVDLWALKQKITMPLLTLSTTPSEQIQYINSDKYTFQLPTNEPK